MHTVFIFGGALVLLTSCGLSMRVVVLEVPEIDSPASYHLGRPTKLFRESADNGSFQALYLRESKCVTLIKDVRFRWQ